MITLPVYKTGDKYTIRPSKIIALGLNYVEHIKESTEDAANKSVEIPPEPILFAKTPNVLIGPEEPILIPAFISSYDFKPPRTDYEAELALIVKDTCKNVPEDKVWDYIYGFTCMNDVSQRNIQLSDKSGWFRGKSFDTFGPIGPQIVLTKDLPDVQKLHIECRVNGKVMQSASTADMIFSISATISFISRNLTLNAGDIIMTGTPSGVGPLSAGDVVEVEVEKIGVLRNPVKAE